MVQAVWSQQDAPVTNAPVRIEANSWIGGYFVI